MSVPFNLEVALAAIEQMTNPAHKDYDVKTIYAQLVAQINTQHPILISEHIDCVDGLIKYTHKLLLQINSTQLSEQHALEKLSAAYSDLPPDALQQVFACCKQRV
jgi:hypothetical protein